MNQFDFTFNDNTLDDAVRITALKRLASGDLTELQKAQKAEYLGYTEELLAKRANLLNDVLSNYLVESEPNANATKVFKNIQQRNTDLARKLKITEYEQKRQKAYMNIIKFIIMISLILIALTILTNFGFMPERIYNIISMIIIAGGVIYVVVELLSIHKRDGINFDKINYDYDPKEAQLRAEKNEADFEYKNRMKGINYGCSTNLDSLCPIDFSVNNVLYEFEYNPTTKICDTSSTSIP